MNEIEQDSEISETNMLSHLKYWARLVVGGLCLPFVFPWLVYLVYQKRLRYRTKKDRSLQDKVVLITGASSGLGEALAHEFYKAGCKVILAARRKEELERVKRDLQAGASSSPEPAVLCLDLSDLQAIPAKAKEVLDVHKRIDILINNGGISNRGEALNTSLDVDLKVMVINYFGQVALTKALLPSMRAADSGSVVTIGSIQGRIAIPFRSSYAASKHALQAFFDTLRSELVDTNIHVCVVSPGYIKTNLSLNAIMGDGSTYGVTDSTTEGGLDPTIAAEEILRAVLLKRDELVLSSVMPRLAIWIRVLLPRLYFFLMRKRASRLRREQHQRKN